MTIWTPLQPYLDNPFLAVLAIAVLVLGAGRLTRVITYDDFPPTEWLRMQWDRITRYGAWAKLAHCFWCAGPWVTLAAFGWFMLGLVVPWIGVLWWLFWGWLGLAYIGSMVTARDEPQ